MKWLIDILNNEELSAEEKQKEIQKQIPLHFVPKDKFNSATEEKDELKKQIEERDKQLVELKAKASDSEALKAQIENLQNQNKETSEQYETKLAEQKYNFALESALAKAEAKNVRAAKALLDTEKIKLDGDALIGFDEQLKTLKESDPYLFGAKLEGRNPNPSTDPPPAKNNPWKSETLNLTEQGRLLQEDPKEAERLKQQAGVN